MKNIEENCLKAHLKYLKFHKLMPHDFAKPVTIRDFLYANLYYPVVFYWILVVIHLYKAYGDPSVDLSIDVLTIMILTYNFYVFAVYYWKLNDIVPFINNLKDFTKFGRPRDFDKLVEKQNKYMKYIYNYIAFTVFVYIFYSYYSTEQCERRAVRESTTRSCILLLPLWLPYDLLANFYVRLLVFVLQAVFVLCCVMPAVAATYSIASITELMTARVIHLKDMFKEISAESSSKEKTKKLINCIRYHIDIVKLVNQAYHCFAILNFAHFFLSSAVLGLIYYRILKMFLLKDLIQVNGWIFSIWILCHTGQQIINESESLLNDVYSLDWPDMDNHSKYCIRIMLLRMQTPLNFGAGIFDSYSNEFLLKILQGSYAYITVMNFFFNKNKQNHPEN